MPRPTLGPTHAALNALAGAWAGTEHLPPSPWVPTDVHAPTRLTLTAEAGGFAVAVRYAQHQGDRVAWSGHGVFSVDRGSGDVMLHWWDSSGHGPEVFRGEFAEDRLTLERASARGRTRVVWVRDGDRLHRAMETAPPGGTWSTTMTGEYTRPPG